MGALLHFYRLRVALYLVAGYRGVLKKLSYVVLFVGLAYDNVHGPRLGRLPVRLRGQAYNHSIAEFTSFFGRRRAGAAGGG